MSEAVPANPTAVQPKKYYSGLPDDPRLWAVPRWVKVVFVAVAFAAITSAVSAILYREFGGAGERARLALDGQLLEPPAAAADFKFPKRGGGEKSLADYRGKVVFLNFWGSFCVPCREEMPSMAALARKLDPSTFAMVAISADQDWAAVDKFFGGAATPYDVLLDTGGASGLAKRYGTSKIPDTYLIDAEGRVRVKFENLRDWSDPNAVRLLESLGAPRVQPPA